MARPAHHQLVVLLVALLVVSAAPPPAVNAAGLTCEQVMTTLAPCVKYINATKRSNLPGCCNAIWNLIVASRRNNTSTAARQATCECLKQQSSNFVHGNKLMIMASLAGRCRMNIPYPFPISPLTDCSRVH
ncbi:hypothetical protein QOZ80_5BG0426180 [Eleusine coracana subsp. coracana]|nr:hypothetical protein QOZ80_5BG0426180 [Eleusine coracana subsp. coracana]